MLGTRSVKQVLGALLEGRNYVALANMLKNYPEFWGGMSRYLSGNGDYPFQIRVRTPSGIVAPTLYSYHDMLTVNEIFCRRDYPATGNDRVIVDIGSNIGLSALYFLTRNSSAKCYLFEPDVRNVARLKKNLAGFEPRYTLVEKAVSDAVGRVEFGIEPTGRYGGIGVVTGQTITVDCLAINDVLTEVLDKEGAIDILKIDTEGIEVKTVEAIKPELARRIRHIFIEGWPDHRVHPELFSQRQYGSVCQWTNKSLTAISPTV